MDFRHNISGRRQRWRCRIQHLQNSRKPSAIALVLSGTYPKVLRTCSRSRGMKRLKTTIFIACAFLALCLKFAASAEIPTKPASAPGDSNAFIHRAPNPNASAAYKWLDTLLEASGREVDRNKPRPTILSRTMAIVLTAMYD